MRKVVLVLSLVTMCLVSSTAQKYGIAEHSTPEGIAVGEAAPEIDLTDHVGEKFLLSESLRKGPVVLVFYRGNWCPYCSRFLAELGDAMPDIKAAGAQLIGVSPESAEQLSVTHEEVTGGSITLLYDEDDEIMKSYDVAFEVHDDYQNKLSKKLDVELSDHNDQEVAVLPVAATYIINKDGMVVYRHFDLDYSQRADIKEILAELQKLKG